MQFPPAPPSPPRQIRNAARTSRIASHVRACVRACAQCSLTFSQVTPDRSAQCVQVHCVCARCSVCVRCDVSAMCVQLYVCAKMRARARSFHSSTPQNNCVMRCAPALARTCAHLCMYRACVSETRRVRFECGGNDDYDYNDLSSNVAQHCSIQPQPTAQQHYDNDDDDGHQSSSSLLWFSLYFPQQIAAHARWAGAHRFEQNDDDDDRRRRSAHEAHNKSTAHRLRPPPPSPPHRSRQQAAAAAAAAIIGYTDRAELLVRLVDAPSYAINTLRDYC